MQEGDKILLIVRPLLHFFKAVLSTNTKFYFEIV